MDDSKIDLEHCCGLFISGDIPYLGYFVSCWYMISQKHSKQHQNNKCKIIIWSCCTFCSSCISSSLLNNLKCGDPTDVKRSQVHLTDFTCHAKPGPQLPSMDYIVTGSGNDVTSAFPANSWEVRGNSIHRAQGCLG